MKYFLRIRESQFVIKPINIGYRVLVDNKNSGYVIEVGEI